MVAKGQINLASEGQINLICEGQINMVASKINMVSEGHDSTIPSIKKRMRISKVGSALFASVAFPSSQGMIQFTYFVIKFQFRLHTCLSTVS